MAQLNKPEEEKAGKVLVIVSAIIALVVVTWLDLAQAESVSPFVYGGLVGAIVGVDALKRIIK
jgi:cytosine/uracil/thiamine/allantoin permease